MKTLKKIQNRESKKTTKNINNSKNKFELLMV